jgi:hypothetical protein
MKQWESRLLKLLGTIFGLLILTLVIFVMRNATQRTITLMPTPTEYTAKFFALRLRSIDLPDGYRGQSRPTSINEQNGLGQEYIFWLQELNSSFNIAHSIIIFETFALAEAKFNERLKERRQTIFHVNQGLEAAGDQLYATNLAWSCDQPLTTANSEFIIRTRYCTTVATYQNVYIEISGQTFTDNYLTMEKYFELVKRLDQRAGEVLRITKH